MSVPNIQRSSETDRNYNLEDHEFLKRLNLSDQVVRYLSIYMKEMKTANSQSSAEMNGTHYLRNYDLPETNSTNEMLFLVNSLLSLSSVMKEEQISKDLCYCNGTMRNMAMEYRNLHGYISLFVCIFGTLANYINIAVLTRKKMKTAPFAYILTWLAVTDMLLMMEYIPFVLYMYTDSNFKITRFSYGAAFYILIHTHLSQVLHTMSICLTLTLAFWRHNAIRYPEKCNVLWTKQKCTTAVKFAMLLPIVICAPSYFMFSVQSVLIPEGNEEKEYYFLDLSDLAKSKGELLYILNLWLYAVVIKLLPCIILIIISVALLKALRKATIRKQKLQAFDGLVLDKKNIKLEKTRRKADRSSHMLIAILFLFLLTELPQCVLGVLSGVLGQCFFKNCYHLFGEVMDILALLNGAINFILYCTMSKQFRSAFTELFHVAHIFKKENSTFEYHI